jgi:hypothetical protein
MCCWKMEMEVSGGWGYPWLSHDLKRPREQSPGKLRVREDPSPFDGSLQPELILTTTYHYSEDQELTPSAD